LVVRIYHISKVSETVQFYQQVYENCDLLVFNAKSTLGTIINAVLRLQVNNVRPNLIIIVDQKITFPMNPIRAFVASYLIVVILLIFLDFDFACNWFKAFGAIFVLLILCPAVIADTFAFELFCLFLVFWWNNKGIAVKTSWTFVTLRSFCQVVSCSLFKWTIWTTFAQRLVIIKVLASIDIIVPKAFACIVRTIINKCAIGMEQLITVRTC